MQNATPVMKQNEDEQIEAASRVVEKVAQAKGADVLDLDPLFDELDTDALNELVAHSEGMLEITFEYEGYTVSIGENGRVFLER